MTEAVARTMDEGLTLLTLSRPDSMNALSTEIKEALDLHIADFLADPAQRCLVLTGSGSAFCAGGDLSSLANGHTPAQTQDRLRVSHRIVRMLLSGSKPVITAVNGAAVGAGFSLALMGDVVLASDEAYFLPAFPQVGVAADLALALTLPRAIGMPRAKDVLLNNRKVEGAEAERIGLISRLLAPEELMECALTMGRRLAAGATLASGLTKGLLHAGYEQPLETFLALETSAQTLAFASDDCREGVAAFFGRRKPAFTGS
ncbi:MAG TPA: enoyl-CoA hydratase-related protein [Steroidobacteraceae bacterium]|nr:enoyl-CoA hydratase-related protein [Steroidobacteraceae bacterium]